MLWESLVQPGKTWLAEMASLLVPLLSAGKAVAVCSLHPCLSTPHNYPWLTVLLCYSLLGVIS